LLAQPAAVTVSVSRTFFVASIENIVTGTVIPGDGLREESAFWEKE
jgi:hypothetical protein